MNASALLILILSLSFCAQSVEFTGFFNSVYKKVVCSYGECCSRQHVPQNLTQLKKVFSEKLYGQQIAQQTIYYALLGHLLVEEPPKALAMSFHGPPGTGKNYVANLIATSFYANGVNSKFYQFFNGRNDFPSEQDLPLYKARLHEIIEQTLANCENSMFVFDEVDKMPEGLLNVLVPFLDYSDWTRSHSDFKPIANKGPYKKKAIFIFLSNTGSSQIVKQLLQLWEEGKNRDDMKLQDFENLVAIGAFNEKGGFHHSDAIESNVIDHYVPFLPLEEEHIRKCVENIFRSNGVPNPPREMIEEAMSHATYGPPPHNLYANAGCKRFDQKVISLIYKSGSKTYDEL